MAEMLEHLTVFVSDCNFHIVFASFYKICETKGVFIKEKLRNGTYIVYHKSGENKRGKQKVQYGDYNPLNNSKNSRYNDDVT